MLVDNFSESIFSHHVPKIYVKFFCLAVKVKVITGPLTQTVKRCLTTETLDAKEKENRTVLLGREALEELLALRQEMGMGVQKMQHLTFQPHLRKLRPWAPLLA